ncbi:MAG: hypothetical protein QOJ99_2828 [Bryobacterales bacterium]|jgi:hypothetical protein|nr:hypothetical protein [Bryobacterales bacterium]
MSYAANYAESRGTLQVCVPEQANGSTMKDSYEVSAKLSAATDL